MRNPIFLAVATVALCAASAAWASDIRTTDGTMRQDLAQTAGDTAATSTGTRKDAAGFPIYHQVTTRWSRHHRNTSSPAPK